MNLSIIKTMRRTIVFRNLYRLLDAGPTPTKEELKCQYLTLAKKYHPDNKVSGSDIKFKEMQKAYHILSTPEVRKQYDSLTTTEQTLFLNEWYKSFNYGNQYATQLLDSTMGKYSNSFVGENVKDLLSILVNKYLKRGTVDVQIETEENTDDLTAKTNTKNIADFLKKSDNILFLVDHSSSMEGINEKTKCPYYGEVYTAIINLLAKINEHNIKKNISITKFTYNTKSIFTCEQLTKNLIQRIKKYYYDDLDNDVGGGTALYNSMDNVLSKHDTDNTTFVVLTDGEDNGSKISYQTLAANPYLKNATIIFVVINLEDEGIEYLARNAKKSVIYRVGDEFDLNGIQTHRHVKDVYSQIGDLMILENEESRKNVKLMFDL